MGAKEDVWGGGCKSARRGAACCGAECVRREGTSEAAPAAVRQAVGGGCRSGWGRLLSVANAIASRRPQLGIGWECARQWMGLKFHGSARKTPEAKTMGGGGCSFPVP